MQLSICLNGLNKNQRLTPISCLNLRKDSIVTDRINFDILRKAKEIQEGNLSCPELLGHYNESKTKDSIPTAIQKHLTGKC